MLKKRERSISHQNYQLPERNAPSQPLIDQISSIESPELFEIRNIILLLQSQSVSTILKQLAQFLSKHKPNPVISQLIYSFLAKRQIFSKSILLKLHLTFQNFSQLISKKQHLGDIGDIMMFFLKRNNINQIQYCQLIRNILDLFYFSKFSKISDTFVQMIVYLLKFDPNKDPIIFELNLYLQKYFISSQLQISLLFSQLLKLNEFQHSIQQFLKILFKNNPILEPEFERYIIHNMKNIIRHFKFDKTQVFEFLCIKMKSMDRDTRKTAVDVAIDFPITSKMVSMVIQKDVLQKTAINRRGILLQLLEDQYKDIRVAAIRCLKKYLLYLNVGEVKQILLYMINDQSDQVRVQALQALIVVAKGYVVTRSDLQIILMPLQQSSRLLRHLCYKVIEVVAIENQNLFVEFVQKLLKAYNKYYKDDKLFLYKVMQTFGNNYPQYVINNIKQFIGIQSNQEPNWRNFIHKGKIILISNAFAPNYAKGIQQNKSKLPSYFSNHFEYIKDMQPHAFQKSILPLQALPLFLKIKQPNKSSFIKIIQTHRQFWSNLPVNSSTIKERFFAFILNITQSIFNLQNALQSCDNGGIYLLGKISEIYEIIFEIRGKFENFDFPVINTISLVLFQYILLSKLNTLQFNKSDVSKITIANSQLICSYIQKYGNNQFLSELQQCNKQIMTTLNQQKKRAKSLKSILLRNLLFENLFNQLNTVDNLSIVEPTFCIECIFSPSNFPKQYLINCQITNSLQTINNYRLKIITKDNEVIIRILDSDSKEQQMQQQHKRLYSIELFPHQFTSPIIQIQALKQSMLLPWFDKIQQDNLKQIIKLQNSFVILDSLKL